MANWTIRTATSGDGSKVEALLLNIPEFAGTIHPNEERHAWQWLYTRPGRPLRNVLISEDVKSKHIIGHYGMCEMAFHIDGREATGGLLSRLAILETHRKEPVFLNLNLRLMREYAANGVDFAIGLVTRKGLLEFHRAFGLKDIGSISVYAKPFRFMKLAREMLPWWTYPIVAPFAFLGQTIYRSFLRVIASLSKNQFKISRIYSFGVDYDSFAETLLTKYRYFAVRNCETLNWRFILPPHRNYLIFDVRENGRLVGYFVLRKMDMKGFHALGIVDLIFDLDRKDLWHAIFAQIDKIALEEGCDLSSIMVSSQQVSANLKRYLYFKSPEHFTLIVHEPKNGMGLAHSNLKDWYLTWFDHDYV